VAPLLDWSAIPDRDPSLEAIQLLEGHEYLYQIDLTDAPTAVIDTDRPEVFYPDSQRGDRGRLRPGLYTGTLNVAIRADGQTIGTLAFEVRSRKLDYLSQYRWMLRDIAEQLSELVMQRFAPAEQRFSPDHARDAATLYQRFAFLRTFVTGEVFEAAMGQVLARPHRAWIAEEQARRPGQGFPAGSALARQLVTPGPRVPWRQPRGWLASPSLPAYLHALRTEETLDTPENRFVKFVLTRWRDLAAQLGDVLERERPSPAVQRGRREVTALVDQLDCVIAEDLFQEVGALTHFPAGSQVLQKREGYRDLFRAYVQSEAAALLAWQGGEDVYGAGQRDVATLYEFWAFLQLANVVSQLCEQPFDFGSLIELRSDGLGLRLQRGRAAHLTGVATRLGRRLKLELWFNRSFHAGADNADSWSRPMRPDCSLLMRPADENAVPFERVWLHFDAKYRVEGLLDLFGPDRIRPEDEDVDLLDAEQAEEARGTATRADLLKMHAYRDAIRRSAGSYVLYPGTEPRRFPVYHEILPGIGAFAMRPTGTGPAAGADTIERFLNDVLDHVASQLTQHERWRYWTTEIYRPDQEIHEKVAAAPYLTRPPADTLILLGYVKSGDHLAWIHRTGRYNVRAGGRRGKVELTSRELAVDLILLYGPDLEHPELWRVAGEPEILTRAQMLEMSYPDPTVDLYFCLPLEAVDPDEGPPLPSRDAIVRLRARLKTGVDRGEPLATTWLDVARSIDT
jgi:predicted component of viral defense system (DUF524 family)